MKLLQAVRPGPGQYLSEERALTQFQERIDFFERPVILTGEKSFAAFEEEYCTLDLAIYRYDRTFSDEDAQRLAEEIGQVDLIVAIGGGKVCDTEKFVSQ